MDDDDDDEDNDDDDELDMDNNDDEDGMIYLLEPDVVALKETRTKRKMKNPVLMIVGLKSFAVEIHNYYNVLLDHSKQLKKLLDVIKE